MHLYAFRQFSCRGSTLFQGAVSGGIIGLAFPLWISFGAYGTVPYSPPLNSTIYMCPPGYTTEPPPDEYPPTADELYVYATEYF